MELTAEEWKKAVLEAFFPVEKEATTAKTGAAPVPHATE
jgi:hypothetical protein